MRRRIWIGLSVVVLLWLLLACGGITILAPVQIAFDIALGWIAYAVRVLPEVRPNIGGIVTATTCALGLAVGGHASLRWLYGQPRTDTTADKQTKGAWPVRWTISLLAIVVLMFVAGISAVGVAHQTAWLITSPEPILAPDESFRRSISRWQSFSNLKALALAMEFYAENEINEAFPAAASWDDNGQPLLSWRVMILPYLEENDLFKEFQ
jgi:hypothetical protein